MTPSNVVAVVTLNPDALKTASLTAIDQTHFMMALIAMVYPNFDEIESTSGFCQCTPETSKEVFQLFFEVAERTKDGLQKGGPWLNYGFSTLNVPDSLQKWEVIPAPATLKKK